jgi:CheY-like chemotaxis protein
MLKKRLRIGIFEDSAIDSFIYFKSFQPVANIEYYIFDTPERGIAALQKLTFDLLIINVHFWGSNYGSSIISKVKGVAEQLPPFIATTSFVQSGDDEKMRTLGFNAYYEKPFIFENLENIILSHAVKRAPVENGVDQ